ncbi:flagellin [Rhodobacter maris]|uniref:Flagellin n=1 Tax=Rhodobacter maris TaxID=446682 RepID=A0A285SH99_9RHOB|nr:flagellin [Rhodobacter maris]SOC06750.1 flagellin [Rhodobacter maris]
MSSILTNSSAMVALQTLKGINSNLAQTQSEISTGKSVSSAKDNSAIWAISKVMESDVAGFETLSTNLATGQSMVSVARTATESITDDLKSIKEKVVAAQDPSADTEKLQAEVDELVSMISSKISGAQFNGINLINSGASDQTIVGSLDRDSTTGAVSANTITVTAQNLGMSSVAATGTVDVGSTDANAATVGADGKSVGAVIDKNTQQDIKFAGLAEGDTVELTLGSQKFTYKVTEADTLGTSSTEDIVVGKLADMINSAGIDGVTAIYDQANAGELLIDNADLAGSGATLEDLQMSVTLRGDGSGDLAGLDGFQVTDAAALTTIEDMINVAVDAAAAFGAVESRLESQASFVSELSDALTSGIGSLVDADMEEASARLQALQTQQQLGIQALSIANQQPQSILSLFK